MVKVKGVILVHEYRPGAHLPSLDHLHPQVDIPQSVMHGWCDARPTVTFPASIHLLSC